MTWFFFMLEPIDVAANRFTFGGAIGVPLELPNLRPLVIAIRSAY